MADGKVVVVHGGSGAVGSAVAKVFAREGARLFLAARTRERLARVAAEVGAEADVVDALEEAEVEAHAARVASRAGRIDVMVSAVGFAHVRDRRCTRCRSRTSSTRCMRTCGRASSPRGRRRGTCGAEG